MFNSNQLHRNVFGGNAGDGSDLLVAEVLQPEQDEGAVHDAQLVDARIELADLFGVLVGVGVEVGGHFEGHALTASLLLAVVGDACVEGDTPDPGVHLRLAPETVEAFPEVDEDFLEQVVDLSSTIVLKSFLVGYGLFNANHRVLIINSAGFMWCTQVMG